MERFSTNNARAYIGKKVNLHLKDGAVIINVQVTKLLKGPGKNRNQIEYNLADHKYTRIPLKHIAYAERLNVNLMRNYA